MPATLTLHNLETRNTDAPLSDKPPPGRLSRDVEVVEPVVRVASRIIAAARRSEFGDLAQAWTVTVYDDEAAQQVIVLPSGSILVYTGTFRLAETECGLAALLSHELAHALANHQETGGDAVGITGKPPVLFTRAQESEADQIGMTLMADAGYDPRETLAIWKRMKELDPAVRDALLSYVTYERRMEQLKGWLPHAFERYRRSSRAPKRALPGVRMTSFAGTTEQF
jgi:predicted Zn-dependent protease